MASWRVGVARKIRPDQFSSNYTFIQCKKNNKTEKKLADYVNTSVWYIQGVSQTITVAEKT